MDWLTKMNAAIDYIEWNLTENIAFDKVAAKAGCSSEYGYIELWYPIKKVSSL